MAMINNMIPSPKGQWGNGELKTFSPAISANDFAPQAESFIAQATRALGINFELNENADIVVKYADYMTDGEYRLDISDKAVLYAHD